MALAELVDRLDLHHIHADFADDAATAAWVAHALTGRPFSFRSHTSFNPQMLRDKLRDSALVFSISEYDRSCLLAVDGDRSVADRIRVNYLGVNLAEFTEHVFAGKRSLTKIVCVGTLQEKKGQHYLVDACSFLAAEGIDFHLVLVGDGPDRGELEKRIDAARIRPRTTVCGYVPNDSARQEIASAAVFCLPSVVAHNGDVDGIPYVLMEAMALGTACVATRVSGIPELIDHGVDGILVPERNTVALVQSLKRLLQDPELRHELGDRARMKVQNKFNTERTAAEAVAGLRMSAATGRPPAPQLEVNEPLQPDPVTRTTA